MSASVGVRPSFLPAFALTTCACTLAALAAGCASREAGIALVMTTPQGVLDGASALTLSVFDAEGFECTPGGGVSGLPLESDIQTFSLADEGCTDGALWCADIQLPRDGRARVFWAVAQGAAGTIAQGCVVAPVDQDPVQVDITMKRIIDDACCGDGQLQVGEQCDPGGSPACGGVPETEQCSASCTTREQLLSKDNAGKPDASNLPAQSKSRLGMSFVVGGPTTPNALRAVFTNESADAVGGSDVHLRMLTSTLRTVAYPVPLASQLILPLLCSDVVGDGTKLRQREPSIAPIGADGAVVVYVSDEALGGSYHVYASLQTAPGCADLDPFQVSETPALNPDENTILPDVASVGDTALVVWQSGPRVVGRLVSVNASVEPAGELEISPSASGARVARVGDGYVVVYQGSAGGDSDAVVARAVAADGTLGPEQKVNVATSGLQDEPDVAGFADGAFAVVWRNGEQVLLQRFGADGAPQAGDQEAPIATGAVAQPAIAAGGSAGDFFVAAWANTASGEVEARFAGKAGGFLSNWINGQPDSFVASELGVPGQRRAPSVAVGGAGVVAIGWQDDSDEHPGVFVRRFPLPF